MQVVRQHDVHRLEVAAVEGVVEGGEDLRSCLFGDLPAFAGVGVDCRGDLDAGGALAYPVDVEMRDGAAPQQGELHGFGHYILRNVEGVCCRDRKIKVNFRNPAIKSQRTFAIFGRSGNPRFQSGESHRGNISQIARRGGSSDEEPTARSSRHTAHDCARGTPGPGGGATISGLVSDESGIPLPGANLVLSGPSLEEPMGTAARADGEYSFAGLEPGRYQLEVSHIGYRTRPSRKSRSKRALRSGSTSSFRRPLSTSSRVSYPPPAARKKPSTPPLRSPWSREPISGTDRSSAFRGPRARPSRRRFRKERARPEQRGGARLQQRLLRRHADPHRQPHRPRAVAAGERLQLHPGGQRGHRAHRGGAGAGIRPLRPQQRQGGHAHHHAVSVRLRRHERAYRNGGAIAAQGGGPPRRHHQPQSGFQAFGAVLHRQRLGVRGPRRGGGQEGESGSPRPGFRRRAAERGSAPRLSHGRRSVGSGVGGGTTAATRSN